MIILYTLSKYQFKLGIVPHYQRFMDKFLNTKVGGFMCVSKLQLLLHRYYSEVFVEVSEE